MKNLFNTKKAYTLIELLVYIAISAIVLTLILTFTVSILDGTTRVGASQEIFHNNRFVMSRIKYDVEHADSLNTALSVFDDDSGQLVLNHGSGTISYYVNNSKIERQVDSDTPEVILTTFVQVDILRFENRTQPSGQESVNVKLSTSIINPDNSPELDSSQEIETNILVRN